MDPRKFYSRIQEDKRFSWLWSVEGSTPAEDIVLVKTEFTGARFEIMFSAIKEHGWDELESMLLGERQPTVMDKFTRIVGYYSKLTNWNRSKIAELQDRHKGNYTLSEGSKNVEEESRKSKKETAPARELAGV